MSTIEETTVVEPRPKMTTWLDFVPEITTSCFLLGVVLTYVVARVGGFS